MPEVPIGISGSFCNANYNSMAMLLNYTQKSNKAPYAISEALEMNLG